MMARDSIYTVPHGSGLKERTTQLAERHSAMLTPLRLHKNRSLLSQLLRVAQTLARCLWFHIFFSSSKRGVQLRHRKFSQNCNFWRCVPWASWAQLSDIRRSCQQHSRNICIKWLSFETAWPTKLQPNWFFSEIELSWVFCCPWLRLSVWDLICVPQFFSTSARPLAFSITRKRRESKLQKQAIQIKRQIFSSFTD